MSCSDQYGAEQDWQKQHSDTLQRRQRLGGSTHPLASLYARRNASRATLDDRVLAPFNNILDYLCANHPLLGDNDIQLLEPAELALEAMFLSIREARHHIHISTYIFNDDAVGKRLMDLLVEKARRAFSPCVYDAPDPPARTSGGFSGVIAVSPIWRLSAFHRPMC